MPPSYANFSDCIIVPLTNQQRTVSHLTVDVAFHYPRAAEPKVLMVALSNVLASFLTLCGRLVRVRRKNRLSEGDSDEDELLLCVPKLQYPVSQWAYVPFAHDELSSAPPTQDGIASDSLFDIATGCIPSTITHDISSYGTCINESIFGAPLTRIKVTTISPESQMIALSINHTLVDARSISMFMSAWSEEFQHCRTGHMCRRTKISFVHPIFEEHKARNDMNPDVCSIPEEWKRLLPKEDDGANPFVKKATSSDGSARSAAVCTVYYRSPEQIRRLKQHFIELEEQKLELGTSHPPYLSCNDALCGEICTMIGATSVLLCMDWRPVLQRKDFFGYGVVFLYLSFLSAIEAPFACRAILGWKDAHGNVCNGVVRDPNFVRWKIDNEWRQGSVDLIWNSWADFFILSEETNDNNDSKATAKMELHPNDILMSQQMCQLRIDVATKADLSYCIVFPQPKGVRVYLFGPRKDGHDLSSSYLRI